MRIEVTAGPDAGRHIDLPPGRHLVGRAHHASLALDDPSVEAHHLLLDIAPDESVTVVQLTGRTPIMVDGESIEVGDSRLDMGIRDITNSGVVLGIAVRPPLHRAPWRDGTPVLADLDPIVTPRVGLVDLDPDRQRAASVARSILSQLARAGRPAPEIVVAESGYPALETCAAVLEIGARWRACWTPDVTRPDDNVRLHAAGASARRVEIGAFVGQEVARARAVLGGDIVRVPEPAGRE